VYEVKQLYYGRSSREYAWENLPEAQRVGQGQGETPLQRERIDWGITTCAVRARRRILALASGVWGAANCWEFNSWTWCFSVSRSFTLMRQLVSSKSEVSSNTWEAYEARRGASTTPLGRVNSPYCTSVSPTRVLNLLRSQLSLPPMIVSKGPGETEERSAARNSTNRGFPPVRADA